ncbi:hypothetical protein CDV25_04550 [Helicobacter apodemus]|uniref:DUF721 domain-containing protein n=1 Tax=Helicobacter apodemus TaxID=135569 RepID=A0A2U8FDA1_9HELI|nr:hypothetical protein CDV25_04550 [Helicobacter apodemus]
MKKVSQILSHLFNTPSYQKLHQTQQIKGFLWALPKSLRDGVCFCYIKNQALFFALKHPCYKQEFDYKLTIIKQLLKQYQQSKEELLGVMDIKAFVSNNAYQKFQTQQAENLEVYGEIAKGDFENLAKDKEIREIFESIRKAILCNH